MTDEVELVDGELPAFLRRKVGDDSRRVDEGPECCRDGDGECHHEKAQSVKDAEVRYRERYGKPSPFS